MDHVLPHERIRLGMSIKFQIPGVFADLSVRQHLQLSLHRAKDDEPGRIDELLHVLGLDVNGDADDVHAEPPSEMESAFIKMRLV